MVLQGTFVVSVPTRESAEYVLFEFNSLYVFGTSEVIQNVFTSRQNINSTCFSRTRVCTLYYLDITVNTEFTFVRMQNSLFLHGK